MPKKCLRIYFPQNQDLSDEAVLYGCTLLNTDSSSSPQCLVILGAIPSPSIVSPKEQLNVISRCPGFQEVLVKVNGNLVTCGTVGEPGPSPKQAGLWTWWQFHEGKPQLVKLLGGDRAQIVQVIFYQPCKFGAQHSALDGGEWSSLWSSLPFVKAAGTGSTQHPSLLYKAATLMEAGPWINQALLLAACNGKITLEACYSYRSWNCVLSKRLQISGMLLSRTGNYFLSLNKVLHVGSASKIACDTASVNHTLMRAWHTIYTVILELILGSIMGWTLWHQASVLSAWLPGTITSMKESLHCYVVWLAAEPAGLKLHGELAHVYSWLVLHVINFTIKIYSLLVPHIQAMVQFVSVCSSVGGLALGLAMVYDAMSLLMLPITAAYTVAALVYSYQLKFIRFTWKLLRGHYSWQRERFNQWRKIQNVQEPSPEKHATVGPEKGRKADEVVMEHLIVGVLLFTPLLALLPTTMVFYASLLAVYLVTAALQSCLVVLCEAIAVDHIYFASLRFLRPGLLPGGFKISEIYASEVLWGAEGNDGCKHTLRVPYHTYLFESLPVKWSTFPEFAVKSVIEKVKPPSWKFVRRVLAGNLVFRR